MLSKTTAEGTKIIQLSEEKFSTMKRSQPLKQLSLKSTLVEPSLVATGVHEFKPSFSNVLHHLTLIIWVLPPIFPHSLSLSGF